MLGELEHAGVAAGPLAPDTDREDDRSSALGCGAAGGAPLCPPLGGVCPNAPQVASLCGRLPRLLGVLGRGLHPCRC